MTTPIFDQAHPKTIETAFCFPKFAPPRKKIRSFHQFILEIQPILESHDQTNHPHFWPSQCKKFFDQLLIYLNLYQHAKNQAILLIGSGDMVD